MNPAGIVAISVAGLLLLLLLTALIVGAFHRAQHSIDDDSEEDWRSRR